MKKCVSKYVRDDVGNVIVQIRNEPVISIVRSKDVALRNRFSVLRVPISSRVAFLGVETDGILAFLAIQDGFDQPLNNIDRRALAVLIIQNTCKRLVQTT